MNTGQKTISGFLIVVAGLLVVNLGAEVSGERAPYDPLDFDSWTPEQHDPWAGWDDPFGYHADLVRLHEQQSREMRKLRRSNERIAQENRWAADRRQSRAELTARTNASAIAAMDFGSQVHHGAGCECARCQPHLYDGRTDSTAADPNPFANSFPTSDTSADVFDELYPTRSKQEARILALEDSVRRLGTLVRAKRANEEMRMREMEDSRKGLLAEFLIAREVRKAEHDALMDVMRDFNERLENLALMVRHAHAADEQQQVSTPAIQDN